MLARSMCTLKSFVQVLVLINIGNSYVVCPIGWQKWRLLIIIFITQQASHLSVWHFGQYIIESITHWLCLTIDDNPDSGWLMVWVWSRVEDITSTVDLVPETFKFDPILKVEESTNWVTEPDLDAFREDFNSISVSFHWEIETWDPQRRWVEDEES